SAKRTRLLSGSPPRWLTTGRLALVTISLPPALCPPTSRSSRSIARLRQKKPDHRAIIVTLRPSENLCKIPGAASSVVLLGVTTILGPDSGNEGTFSRRACRPRSTAHPRQNERKA